MTNTGVDLAKIGRRVKVIRSRLRTTGPNHADAAYLADRVEQLAMLYQASQDANGMIMHEHTATVDLLRGLWNYAGGPSFLGPDGKLVPGMERGTLGEVWKYLGPEKGGSDE